jgi:hypothetical protein
MQLYVNSPHRRRALDAAALDALPSLRAVRSTQFRWRSPLARPLFDSDRPFHEYRDGKLFDALARPNLRRAWSEYWPARSPKWDGVALALNSDGKAVGCLLVEAKSPGEFRPASGGTRSEGDRRSRIVKRLAETRDWLKIRDSPEVTRHREGDLYQAGNRYATLRFFRDFVDPPVAAWLLSVYFLDDQTHLSPARRAR